MKNSKNENLGCIFSAFVAYLLLVFPSMMISAFVLQKLSFWFFNYMNDFHIFVGIVLVSTMLTRDGDSAKNKKDDESMTEYIVRSLSDSLVSTLVKPVIFLTYGYLFYVILV